MVYCLFFILKHCALASIRIWDKIVLLVYQIKHSILNFRILNLFKKISWFIIKIGILFILYFEHCALASIRMWDMALSHSSSLVWGWPLSVVVRLLDLFFWNWKLDAPLNYDYDIIGTLMNDYTAKMSLEPDDCSLKKIFQIVQENILKCSKLINF